MDDNLESNLLPPEASSSALRAQMLMQRGKMGTAAQINNACSFGGGGVGAAGGDETPDLDELLDILLDPEKPIDESETIDWCKWLIAGGRTPTEFSSIGKS